jgi:SAM-dependent methyltransferase
VSLTAPDLELIVCPLCGCADSSTVVTTTEDYFGGAPGTYSASRCHTCRHVFMNPRPSAATLHLCYPATYAPHQTAPSAPPAEQMTTQAETPWYLKYLPLRHVPGLRAFYYWLTNDLGQPLPRMPKGGEEGVRPKAVELGCAAGRYLSRLAAAGWDPVGVEPSESASATARECGFDVWTGVLHEVPLPAHSFDCATAWMVIEHVIDPVSDLKQLHDVLKPGGQLLISIPNAGCWEPIVFRSAWFLWDLPRHLHHFTPFRIRKTLETAGFTKITIVHQKNVLNLIGSLGIVLSRLFPTRDVGRRLVRYTDAPQMWVQLALSPLAHLLAICRQGGRLTVYAERPKTASSDVRSSADKMKGQ